MIRVTFGECKYINYSNKVMEFKDYHAYRNFIENCSFAYTVTQSIIKFEKQIKDLTIQEIYKYVTLNYANVEQIEIFADCILIILGGGGPFLRIVLNNDDYIDITHLIKGE